MWFLRRLLRVSWKEKKSNEVVLDEAHVGRSMLKTIRKRQMQFLGHLNGHKGLEHQALTCKIKGKRGRGRPRATYLGSLNKWVTGKDQRNVPFLFW